MLAAEALRLAAVEALCPTAAIAADNGYPTLARHRVFDSRAAALADLDAYRDYTPVLALYTPAAHSRARGPAADAGDRDATAMLDIIGELAVKAVDGSEEYADAMAEEDPQARLVLAALMAQVRYVLEHSQASYIFRRVCKQVIEVDMQTYAVPQVGLRLQRMGLRLTCQIQEDDFLQPAGQLPQPMHRVYQALPAGSYAKAKLAELASHFNPDIAPPLEAVVVTVPPGVSAGPEFD
jgi:hypothetical protein